MKAAGAVAATAAAVAKAAPGAAEGHNSTKFNQLNWDVPVFMLVAWQESCGGTLAAQLPTNAVACSRDNLKGTLSPTLAHLVDALVPAEGLDG